MRNTDVIGIDCSTDPKNVGLAFYDGSLQRITEVREDGRNAADDVARWILGSSRVLLALDAPLGWPLAFEELAQHTAGRPVSASRTEAFNRVTDRFVKETVGQQPLRVGADLIAMTAHWALSLLDTLRRKTSLDIPLAWAPSFTERAAAIEVYPAATLRARRLRCTGYKDRSAEHADVRRHMLDSLRGDIAIDVVAERITSSDVFDAVVCCLAGTDFLEGRASPPIDEAVAKKEGWIWVVRPG